MPILGLRNKDGATKQIDVNGLVIAEASESGLQMVKPLKVLASAADDEAVRQDQVILGKLLASGTASNSASVVLSWADTDFDHYLVEWDKVVPAIKGLMMMNPSSDGGSTFDTTVCQYGCVLYASNSATGHTGNVTDGGYRIGSSGEHEIDKISSGILRSFDKSFSYCVSDSAYVVVGSVVVGSSNVHANSNFLGRAMNALRFMATTGNIASGGFRVYGVR